MTAIPTDAPRIALSAPRLNWTGLGVILAVLLQAGIAVWFAAGQAARGDALQRQVDHIQRQVDTLVERSLK